MLPKLMLYQEKKVFSPITLSGHAMDPAWAELPETPEQVTLGHNIIADGWAGASNPHPHPMPPPSTPKPKKASKTLVFQFSTRGLRTDRWTDQRRDRRTDQWMD